MVTRLCLIALGHVAAVAGGLIRLQQPLRSAHDSAEIATTTAPKLHGRFLHITGTSAFSTAPGSLNLQGFVRDADRSPPADLHPDSFYKKHTATDAENVCHHGKGAAGPFGAEVTGCDSPWTLLDATFDWIAANLRDQIDFVIWTGDSVRHDNDPAFPRDSDQVLGHNRRAAKKFLDVFGTGDRHRPLAVPVVPTIGNNDVLPHNAFFPGPNKWTRAYLDVWREFIPKESRRAFDRGGWHTNEVVPGRLAVVSLNSLYWYTKNAAVDGCADPGEPGYRHFEWLRAELQRLRARGLKAIIMGHVPPARTETKQSWDESCWQKYALWMHRYRDVVVGSVWGHVNNDHFMLQDARDVHRSGLRGKHDVGREAVDGGVSVQSTENYLNDLRKVWSRLPTPPKEVELYNDSYESIVESRSANGVAETKGVLDDIFRKFRRHWGLRKDKERQRRAKKFYDEIGGRWAERYTLDLVSPSMVPNYYPTLRLVEYNVTGVQDSASAQGSALLKKVQDDGNEDDVAVFDDAVEGLRNKHKKHRKKHGSFKIPKAPSKSAPPGPAHSPQTFSWLSYQQLFLNITTLNHQYEKQRESAQDATAGRLDEREANASGHKDHDPDIPRNVTFEVEYDTENDREFALKDLTVRSFVQLATRIGKFKPEKSDILCSRTSTPQAPLGNEVEPEYPDQLLSDIEAAKHKKHKKKHKKKKHGKRKIINRTWYAFVERAYVSTLDEDELHDNFGQPDNGESTRLCRDTRPPGKL